jgi:hypothetical protein
MLSWYAARLLRPGGNGISSRRIPSTDDMTCTAPSPRLKDFAGKQKQEISSHRFSGI